MPTVSKSVQNLECKNFWNNLWSCW